MALLFVTSAQRLYAEVVPRAQDIFVMPGEQVSLDIPLENSSSVGKDFTLSLLSASLPAGEENQHVLSALSSDLARWIVLTPDSILLAPNGQGVATLTVRPSVDILPGVYGVAVVATENIDGQIALNHGSAALVFITVGQVSSVGACTTWTRNNDGTFSITLMNTGGGILYENGSVVLRGPFGMSFGSALLNPGEHRVLPGQTRTWNTDSVSVPWWSFGARSFVIASGRLSATCGAIGAGFGWIPIVVFGTVSIICIAVVLRRRR